MTRESRGLSWSRLLPSIFILVKAFLLISWHFSDQWRLNRTQSTSPSLLKTFLTSPSPNKIVICLQIIPPIFSVVLEYFKLFLELFLYLTWYEPRDINHTIYLRCEEKVVKIIKRCFNSCYIEEEWSLIVVNFG